MRDETAQDKTETPIRMGDLADSLGFLLRVSQIKTFDNFYAVLGEAGLKPGEYTVLWAIQMNPGLRQGTIARTLRIKPAHMTKLTSRLVERGLVTRTPSPEDRRAVGLNLTEEGEAFVTMRRDDFLNFNYAERDNLSDEEAEQLIALLKKFTGLNTCR